jgi:hypothetical protein
MTQRKYPLVEIEWTDSCSSNGWGTPERHMSKYTISRCRSVGYLIERNAKHVIVSQSLSDDTGNAAEVLAVPASCIKRLRRLK